MAIEIPETSTPSSGSTTPRASSDNLTFTSSIPATRPESRVSFVMRSPGELGENSSPAPPPVLIVNQEPVVQTTVHVFIDPNSGRVISNDGRFHESDPRTQAEDTQINVEGATHHVLDELVDEADLERLVDAVRRVGEFRQQLQEMVQRAASVEEQQNTTAQLYELLEEISSSDTDTEYSFSTVRRVEREEQMPTPHVRSEPLTPPHYQSTPNGDQTVSSSESDLTLFQSDSTPPNPSGLNAALHAIRQLEEAIQTRIASAETQIQRASLSHPTDLPVTAQVDRNDVTEEAECLDPVDRNDSLGVYSDRIFNSESAAIAISHRAGLTARWRRLINRRRTLFQRMWQQELDFWNNVENQLQTPIIQFDPTESEDEKAITSVAYDLGRLSFESQGSLVTEWVGR